MNKQVIEYDNGLLYMNVSKNKNGVEGGNIRYLTPKELQKILECSKNTVYNLLRYSNLPKIRIGHRYYIPESEFDSWMKDNINNIVRIKK